LIIFSNMPQYSLLCGGKPVSGDMHWGWFVIPQGETWAKVEADGQITAIDGPKTLQCMNSLLSRRTLHVANESQYMEICFVAGHSEVLAGPASLYEDPLLHKAVRIREAVSVNNNE
jgi:hypothetical protein